MNSTIQQMSDYIYKTFDLVQQLDVAIQSLAVRDGGEGVGVKGFR